MRKATPRKKKKNILSAVEFIDELESVEEDGFIEGEVNNDDAIATFCFAAEKEPEINEIFTEQQLGSANPTEGVLLENHIYKATPKGQTPPVDGEAFIVKRSYTLRLSTMRMLNELKSKHPDINIYYNTLVDAAIRHYHSHIINEYINS